MAGYRTDVALDWAASDLRILLAISSTPCVTSCRQLKEAFADLIFAKDADVYGDTRTATSDRFGTSLSTALVAELDFISSVAFSHEVLDDSGVGISSCVYTRSRRICRVPGAA